MTLLATQSSLLQVATAEQQLAQEQQTVQRLEGTAARLQQELDSQRSKLEEQGQCHISRRCFVPDSGELAVVKRELMRAEALLDGVRRRLAFARTMGHAGTESMHHGMNAVFAGQEAEQELKRASAEAESALQSAQYDAAQAQQRVQQLEDDLSQTRSSYASLQQVWLLQRHCGHGRSSENGSCTSV